MKTVILPSAKKPRVIESKTTNVIFVATTTGLKKFENEDRVGFTSDGTETQICITDGHWGEGASDDIINHWLLAQQPFPDSRDAAIRQTEILQSELYKKYSRPNMDAEHDRTPESSFITASIVGPSLCVFSYGDCRLIVCRDGKVVFDQETVPTWLGAFSYLGLRARTPVSDSLVYATAELKSGDCVIFMTDGVTESVYEQPTLSIELLASLTKGALLGQIGTAIFERVFAAGAEDNASLLLYILP